MLYSKAYMETTIVVASCISLCYFQSLPHTHKRLYAFIEICDWILSLCSDCVLLWWLVCCQAWVNYGSASLRRVCWSRVGTILSAFFNPWSVSNFKSSLCQHFCMQKLSVVVNNGEVSSLNASKIFHRKTEDRPWGWFFGAYSSVSRVSTNSSSPPVSSIEKMKIRNCSYSTIGQIFWSAFYNVINAWVADFAKGILLVYCIPMY